MRKQRAQRAIVALATATMAAFALSSCAPAAESAEEGGPIVMNVLTFSGNLAAVNAEVAKGFEEKYNVRINWVEGNPAENVARVVANKDNQIYDAAFADNQSQFVGSEQGAWEKLDHDIVTNLADISDVWLRPTDDGLSYGAFPNGIYYNVAKFKEEGWDAPTSYQDLVDPKYCKVASIPHIDNIGATHALMGLGTTSGNTTPEEQYDAGLKILDEHRDCFDTFEVSSGTLDQKILADEFYVGLAGMARILPIQDSGKDIGFVIPKEGSFFVVSTINVAVNAPNPKLAQELVNWFGSVDAQTIEMEKAYYAPTNINVVVPEDLAERGIIGADQVDTVRPYSEKTIQENREDWVARWNELFG